ncbi:response regulator transcription factor [uncultured Victivallis sp.]|uniref:response regulator n=1 Tax=uncultured Victivallis sp. TaxID=354118 RepID=UPI0025E8D004|nr:response regulator transcription factor [uncultured Victivallis sp.]
MAKEKILVVEDEEAIQELIRYNLNKEGFDRVRLCDSGEEALTLAQEFAPDLILLDLMLPGMDGLSVCRRLRRDARTAAIPVIMLTAKSEESDIVTGLEVGADDYLTKPFSPKVLVARIKSVLRRANPTETEETGMTLRRGALFMNRGTREARIDNEPLSLTCSEFEILYLLARRPGWVFTRSQIVNEVKGDDYPVTERAVDVQMVSLRRKLGNRSELIETVRGVGYRFAQE